MHYVEIDRPFCEWVSAFLDFVAAYNLFPDNIYLKFVETHPDRVCLFWGYTIREIHKSSLAPHDMRRRATDMVTEHGMS
jgi:hypothetical protein